MVAGKNSRERNNRGRWTRQEHEQFLGGLEAVGEIWCLVATYVPTRTELQTRTHAQKYLRKIRQGLPFPEEPYQSAVESDDGAGARLDGGPAAAGNGEAGPPAPLPPATYRHGSPALTTSFFDGHEVSRDSGGGSRNADWYAIGGSHGGGAAPLFAPVAAAPPLVNPDAACLAHYLDGVWLHEGPVYGALALMEQQQLPPWRGHGHGADMAGGRFSPPHGEAAPFRNWPVSDGDLHANLLLEYGTNGMGAPNDSHNNGDDDDDTMQ